MKMKNWSPVIAGVFIGLSILACNIGAAGAPSSEVPMQDFPTLPVDATSQNAPVTEVPATQGSASSSSTAGGCANPYIPVVVGASWNYQLTGPVPDTYAHSILSVDSAGFTEQDVFGTGVTRQGQWKCDNGSLIALDPTGSSNSANISTEGLSINFQTTQQSGVTFPGNLNPGDTWSQSLTLEGTQTINGTDIPSKNQVSTSCAAVGIESVTVTAGAFDAMRVDCQTSMNITITINGTEMPNLMNINSSSWYAPGVGMVKSVSTGSGFDSTIELISYNIP